MKYNKKRNGLLIYIIILIGLMIMSTFVFSTMNPSTESLKYYQVISDFQNNNVSEFTLNLGSGSLEYKNRENKTIKYKVPNVGLFVKAVEENVIQYNKENPDSQVKFNYIPATDNTWIVSFLPVILLIGAMVVFWFIMMKQSTAGKSPFGKANLKATIQTDNTWIVSFLPVILLIGAMVVFWFIMMKQSTAGKSPFGKANLKATIQQGRKATFDDVAGADEEKEELKEIVEFLKQPSKFNELGARIPRGVLLMGPPGTGKTLLARAVAGEANVPFFAISGSDFVQMYVGMGASRVRDLFDQAKKNSPAIIFIDEIDAVGRHRGAGLGGGHDEREQTLNQLLVEMDGFSANEGIIIIAATNRRDILDPALLRPGRFDREVVVGYPDIKGRQQILEVHSKNKPLGFDVDLSMIAKTTVGFTGADLENLMNEAALLAARNNHKAITLKDIEDATIKVVAGPEKKSKVVIEKEKRLTAYHEAGHAICTFYSETQSPVHQISIIPRGMAGGYTMSLPEHDSSYKTKNQMNEEIVVLLGGRVAEKIILNDISTGASNDIERATQIARGMVTKFGFSDKLGPILYGQGNHEVFLGKDLNQQRDYSESIASQIDSEIKNIIDIAYDKAFNILNTNIEKLELVAKYLIKHEKIDAETFVKLMKNEINLEELQDENIEKIESNNDSNNIEQ